MHFSNFRNFHISINLSFRKYLRYTLDQKHYQYCVLPFGLSRAPRIFTKVLSVLAAHLRRCNITIFPYLDNWLIHGRTHQQTSEAVHNMLNFFQRLGLKVNKLKSILTSIQRIKFIFQILDSSASRPCLPQDRFENLSTVDLQLERNPHTYIQLCLTILGHITSCTFVIPYARLHLRCSWSGLKLFYTRSKHHQDMPLIIPPLILSILKWWKNTMNACRGVPFRAPLPSKIIITDSSLLG